MLKKQEGWLEYFLNYFPNQVSTVLLNAFIYFDKESNLIARVK